MVSLISRRALLGAATFACMLIGSWPALAQPAGAAAAGGASGGTEAGLAPGFTVDPAWPKPLPNNWIFGQVAGVAVDRRDHIWIVHRPASLAGAPGARRPQPAAQTELLRRRPAGAGVRPGGQPAAPLGRAGPRLRMAGDRARHLRRRQRLRLARRQRAEGPPDPEVHARRPLRPADRPLRPVEGQQRHREPEPPRRRRGRPRGARALRRRRLRQPARRSSSTARPAPTSATGAPTASGRSTTPALPAYDPAQPPSPQLRQPRPLRAADAATGWSTSATGSTTAYQVFRRDGTFVQEFFVAPRDAAERRGRRPRALARPRAALPVQRGQLERRGAGAPAPRRRRCCPPSGGWGATPGSSMVPHNVAVDSEGSLYITRGGHRPARAALRAGRKIGAYVFRKLPFPFPLWRGAGVAVVPPGERLG